MDYVEEQSMGIVANGAFNPPIFNPSWLCRHGLITEGEEAASTLEIAHAEIAQFSVPGIKFDIQTERVDIFRSRRQQHTVQKTLNEADINIWRVDEKLGQARFRKFVGGEWQTELFGEAHQLQRAA